MKLATMISFARRRSIAIGAAAIFVCLAQTSALAQVENQTGIADPGRAGEQFRSQTLMPDVGPDIQVKSLELKGAPPGAENITFRLNDIRIEGATVYGQNEIARLYADKLGEVITLADLYGIANALMLKYRNDGYVLTQVVVPPQTIDGGIARLQVVEGYINDIVIQGPPEERNALATVQGYASQISRGGPMNVADLERGLLLINDLPGVHARSILSPSASTPGAADLLIIVNREPYDALLSVDNYGSLYLGRLQFTAAGTLNSALGMNEAMTAQAVYAPGTGYELLYGAVSYEQPIGSYGTRIKGFVGVTETDPGHDLAQFHVRGKSRLYSVQVTHPFIRTRAMNLHGRVLFDARNVTTSNDLEPTRRDYLRIVRGGGRFEFLDTLLGTAVNSIDLEISKGLGILGASDEGDANMTRPFGDPQAAKANIELQRLQRLTGKVNLLLSARGQKASDALLSSEEFAVGGISSGRGYDPSEIVGDHGISGKVELQWNDPYPVESVFLDTYQLFGFLDSGRVWNIDATTADGERDSLTSTGFGLRFDFAAEMEGGIAVAFPLTRDVQAKDDKDPSVYFNFSKRF